MIMFHFHVVVNFLPSSFPLIVNIDYLEFTHASFSLIILFDSEISQELIGIMGITLLDFMMLY